MAKKIIKLGTYRTLIAQLNKLRGTIARAVSAPRNAIMRPVSGSARFWRTSSAFRSCPTLAASILSATYCTYRRKTSLPAPSRPIWQLFASSTIR